MITSVTTAKFVYELPRDTYINARLEEPVWLPADPREPKPGLFARIAQRVAAFAAWNRARVQAAELNGMSDRELADIGLNRGDIGRAFSAEHQADLRQARALLS
jgi:uncharacterized protein YjiS (DUF1127 family)